MNTQKQINEQLILAAFFKDKDKIKSLINSGADVNVKNSNDESTPLHFASMYNCTDIADLLIKHRANINAINIHGLTPLHIASAWDNENMVKLLIENGANINIKDNDGNTPLYYAQEYINENIANLLKEHGAIE